MEDLDLDFLQYIFFANESSKNKKDTIQYYKLQQSITDKLDNHDYALIFDEPGAGKTIQGLYSIWNTIKNKKSNENTNILIVAPNQQLAIQWRDEIRRFLHLEFKIISNSKDNKYRTFYNSYSDNLYITYCGSNFSDLGISYLTNRNYYLSRKDADGNHYYQEHDIKGLNYNIFNKYYKYSRVEKESDGGVYQEILYKLNLDYECDSKFNNRPFFLQQILKSQWDLMILDEAHDYNQNFINSLLFKEVITNNESNSYSYIAYFESKQILVLSATPLRTYKHFGDDDIVNEEFNEKLSQVEIIPRKLLSKEKEKNIIPVDSSKLLDITDLVPYQRYFKETVLETESYKNRSVEVLEYKPNPIAEAIWNENINSYRYFGNVFEVLKSNKSYTNFSDQVADRIKGILHIYNKEVYDESDIKLLREFDIKLDTLLNYIQNENSHFLVSFVKLINTRIFLEKIFKSLNFQVFIINSEDTSSDRLNTISKYNESTKSRIIISTWSIGNYGINLPGGNTVICYESSMQINQIEQAFGRIDRLNQGYDDLKLVLFNTSKNYYDGYALAKVYQRMFNDHLPNIPSKNILFTSDYLNKHVKSSREYLGTYNKLVEFINELDEDFEDNLSLSILSETFNDKSIIDNLKDDLVILNDQVVIPKNKIVNRRNLYNNNIKNLDIFFDNMKMDKEDLENNPAKYLSGIIYFWDEDILKIHSLSSLLDQAKSYKTNSTEAFQRNINILNNEIINSDLNNYKPNFNHLMNSMIESKINKLNEKRL